MSNAESRFDQHWISINFSQRFYIAPIGDIHQDIKLHSHKIFSRWCDKWKRRMDRGETVVVIGMGDYNDSLSYRERRIQAQLHESTREAMDEIAEENALKFAKKLEFFKGHCMAWITGNHDYMIDGSRNVSSVLSEQLGGKVCGVGALLTITAKKSEGWKFVGDYDVFVHHGVGGGVTAGATLNSLDRARLVAYADLYMMGHDHKLAAEPMVILRRGGTIKNPHIVEKKQTLVRTGSFLRGYVPGSSSYVAAKCMRPVALGGACVKITPQYEDFKTVDGTKSTHYWFDTETTV